MEPFLVCLALVLLFSGVIALPIAFVLLRRVRALETKQELLESRVRRMDAAPTMAPPPPWESQARAAATAPSSAPLPSAPTSSTAPLPPPAPTAPRAPSPSDLPPLPWQVPPSDPSLPRPLQPSYQALLRSLHGPPRPSPANAVVEWIVGHWLLIAGALVLQLGIAFGVKYSFEQGWVDERVRVLGGLGIGLLLAALSFWRRVVAIKPLSEVLLAAGLSSLYFSGFAAWHFYKLVPLQVALGFLAAVSLLSTIVASVRNLPITAHLAVVGAYLAPPLFARQQDQQVALFLYLFVATSGTLLLASRKPWPGISWIAALATAAIAALWFESYYEPWLLERSLKLHALVLAPVIAMPFARLHAKKSGAHEVGLASWAALHASLVIAAHCAMDQRWTTAGALYAGLAALHGLFALALRRFAPQQQALRRIDEAIALALIPAAAAASFDGSPVTLVLCAQAAWLAWIASRGPAPIARLGALFAIGGVAVRLIAGIPPIADYASWSDHSTRFASSVAAVLLLYVSLRWLRSAMRQEASAAGWLEETTRPLVVAAIEVVELVNATTLLVVALRYLHAASREFDFDRELHFAFIALLLALLGAGLAVAGARFDRPLRRCLGGIAALAAAGGVAMLGARFAFDHPIGAAARTPLLNGPVAAAAASLGLVLLARRHLLLEKTGEELLRAILAVALLLAPLPLLWGEWERAADRLGWSPQRASAGTSILIGLYATALLAASRGRAARVRFVALGLYALLLGKMLLVDLPAMETLGRVVSFVVVGVLLLVAWVVLRGRTRGPSPER